MYLSIELLVYFEGFKMDWRGHLMDCEYMLILYSKDYSNLKHTAIIHQTKNK